MTQVSKDRFSVQRLISILQKPRTRASSKRKQPILDREQIRKQMMTKWKDPGYCNVEFSKSTSMRGKVLNQWELQRISLADRSYKTPKQSKPYQFDRESREFPNVTLQSYPKKFQRYLKQVQSQKQDLLFKEKRTITEGISLFQSISKENCESRIFKPTSTATKSFGFTHTKSFSSKVNKNHHFKTLNV